MRPSSRRASRWTRLTRTSCAAPAPPCEWLCLGAGRATGLI
uniref:Uncharacterized protein n=1 Tax=Anguilla anguilla TaxID=7936 RepID=A0A0E9PRK4_ANGAN